MYFPKTHNINFVQSLSKCKHCPNNAQVQTLSMSKISPESIWKNYKHPSLRNKIWTLSIVCSHPKFIQSVSSIVNYILLSYFIRQFLDKCWIFMSNGWPTIFNWTEACDYIIAFPDQRGLTGAQSVLWLCQPTQKTRGAQVEQKSEATPKGGPR